MHSYVEKYCECTCGGVHTVLQRQASRHNTRHHIHHHTTFTMALCRTCTHQYPPYRTMPWTISHQPPWQSPPNSTSIHLMKSSMFMYNIVFVDPQLTATEGVDCGRSLAAGWRWRHPSLSCHYHRHHYLLEFTVGRYYPKQHLHATTDAKGSILMK